jgi:CheY-like chemotaxis protein
MRHILVVDDSPETRELVQMIVTGMEDISIDYAPNSSEAIDLFNMNSYNACVLDVSLPDITGYYLGQLIRKVCPEMPIAFLTNYEGSYTKENAEDINAIFWAKSDVFSDPMQLRDLLEDLASDEGCSIKEPIEKPEVLKQLK